MATGVKGPIGRGLAVMVVGALAAGALVIAPVGAGTSLTKQKAKKLFYAKKKSDARYVQESEMFTGSFSCPGHQFQEDKSSYGFDDANGYVYATSGGIFTCNASLPDGATIAAVHFSVFDSSASFYVSGFLTRLDLASNLGQGATLASVLSDGGSAPGRIRLSDTTIENPVVDNGNFAYALRMSTDGTNLTAGLYGATVEYTVTGAQGAAA
jgi:hypothetical protein